MTTKVLVPLLGEGVEEVTVSRWLKREGETVKELEPLLEVNTDKVDTEIPSPAAGTVLKIMAQEGEAARVGATLALIGAPGESSDSATEPAAKVPPAKEAALKEPMKAAAGPPAQSAEKPKAPAAPAPAQAATAQPAPAPASAAATPSARAQDVGFVSPVVKRMVAEHGVNLAQVRGTGLSGRITKEDVLGYLKTGAKGAPASAGAKSTPALRPAAADQVIKHTTIRKQIAEHMSLSQKTSPHVLTVMEADMGKVAAHREANKGAFQSDGAKLTFTTYLIAAIAAGLRAFPMVNSSWTEEGVLVHGDINVGMAVSLGEEGLIVPVIKGADNMSLLGVARAVSDLATRARAHKLQPNDVRGGTFTLTNHGTAGSLFAMPIINQPQCGILGTGAIQKRVVVVEDAAGRDAFAVRPMIYLSLVFDHRILDGAGADAFLAHVKQSLETWA